MGDQYLLYQEDPGRHGAEGSAPGHRAGPHQLQTGVAEQSV